MRTCPACGEDTEAGSAEPCTECGFSPANPDVFEAESDPRYAPVGFEQEPEAEPTFEVASTEAPPEPAPAEPTPAEPAPPEPTPSESPPKAPKRSVRRQSAIWIAIAAIVFLADFTGVFGVFGVFDEATGPTPEEVEGALVLYAFEQGGTVTVDCPEDTEDTEVGDSFDCVATNLRGQTRNVTVTNNEDDFSWDGMPLIQLIRSDR